MQDVNQEASKLSFVYVPGEQLSLVVHIPHLLYYMNLWLGARNNKSDSDTDSGRVCSSLCTSMGVFCVFLVHTQSYHVSYPQTKSITSDSNRQQ